RSPRSSPAGYHWHMSVLSVVLLARPRSPTLLPYTTLFRSPDEYVATNAVGSPAEPHSTVNPCLRRNSASRQDELHSCSDSSAYRSEEHTSELQSRENLVCRLLLEKKNISKNRSMMIGAAQR